MTGPVSGVGDTPGDPPGGGVAEAEETRAFTVHLTNFTGPFDLLLGLIDSRRLDVTEVALHMVTDEFIAHARELGREAGLEEVTEFLVVAATLLDLKTARLVPSGEVQDPEDLALLQARDLLFARLLQFRAFRQVAELFAELDRTARHSHPRTAGPDDEFLDVLPEVELGVDVEQFATIAAVAFRPRPVEEVGVAHVHTPTVSVPEQAARVLELLRFRGRGQWVDFRDLVSGCGDSLVVVARFLALLELYRARAVALAQDEALGDLSVSWTGEEAAEVTRGRDEWM
ncbi:segregation/condensation protein A [Dietzia sp. DQ12-76]|nr:segregation/condensation protein A [Dietzia sp. JS16-p6b]MBB1024026.1 segregation/condensation protein A [Dietzia sp. DQ12-76]MBB1027071.1 segregation/condensation protein A [Dietzia sp. DQ11-38-2]QGW24569.1 chromosome segregation and condensation protein ScpA [Dietzia sp. DQ12-45-1b]